MKKTVELDRPKTLNQWTSLIWNMDLQKLESVQPGYLFMKLVAATGRIAEDVRRNRYYKVRDDSVECFVAIFTLYKRVENELKLSFLFSRENYIGLEKYMFYRFPRRCWACGCSRCECYIKFADHEERKKKDYEKIRSEVDRNLMIARNKEKAPRNIDDWGDLFKGIYGQGHRYMDFGEIGFHLLEEIGEISKALDELAYRSKMANGQQAMAYRDSFVNELCDSISWLFALRQKASYHIVQARKNPKDHHRFTTLDYDLSKFWASKPRTR